jgi:acyl-CoA synthetase (NDP forming)
MRSLSESESKQLLAGYGVPVVQEIIAKDREDAVQAAIDLKFPVVLKGHGTKLTHKSDRGLVHLGLKGGEPRPEIAQRQAIPGQWRQTSGYLRRFVVKAVW